MTALKTILYFDYFRYPITRTEILQFSNIADAQLLDEELKTLLDKKVIHQIDGFYMAENNPELIERRLRGNEMARKMIPKAVKTSRFIAKFPFVESVSLSGGLSKGYYDNEGDFDFFIITKPDRLWIARTFLILYKKLFLFNSKKYFCVNYFITSDHLLIPEQNRFTATEIATLIPICGKETVAAFFEANLWARSYFPNKPLFPLNTVRATEKNMLSKMIQRSLDGNLGLKLDHYLQKLTIKKWMRKFSHLAAEDFNIAMKSTRKVSKHHPQNYQNKVIKRLNEQYAKVMEKYNLNLPEEHA